MPAGNLNNPPANDLEITYVIHCEWGTFKLTGEMARWLRDNHGWELHEGPGWNDIPESARLKRFGKDDYDLCHDADRRAPELAACVRHFITTHGRDYTGLRVRTLRPYFYVTDHDGKETLHAGFHEDSDPTE